MHATWTTLNELLSDHLPIHLQINTKTNYKLQQQRQSYTNYRKANWTEYTNEIEDIISNTQSITNVHTANKIITNAILSADKHHIPKGKIQQRNQILPEPIRNKINTRDHIRTHNPLDTQIKIFNEEITKEISQHKSNIWKGKLNENLDHKHNTHILWNTIHSLSNNSPRQQSNRTISFNNKEKTSNIQIATAFNKQFVHATKYSTSHEKQTH